MTVPNPIPGWKYIAIRAGTKLPIHENWPALATDDPATLAAWEADYNCNWAVAAGPSGLAIVDIDGDQGEESFFTYELECGSLPKTREHLTPGGGRHLIFRGDMPNSVGKLGPKIDTRGRHGSS